MKFRFYAFGHPLIKATHKSTFEITKENFLTERGDCIIGIKSTCSVKDLSEEIKNHLKSRGKILIILECEDVKEEVVALGCEKLTFLSETSIVVRKSEFVDERTLAIKSNKAAKDINRELIRKLKEGKKLKVTICLL